MGRHWPDEVAEKRRLKRAERARVRDEIEDEADLALVLDRMATDTGERYSLDDVMAEHGITQADLDER